MRTDKIVTEMLGEEIALTPSDVCGKKFRRTVIGGYDRRQVDRFLERVADVIEHLLEQVRNLKAAQQEQRSRIEEYRDMESTLRTALGASQRLAEDVVGAARREADAIIVEARAKRAQHELDGRRVPEALRREVQVLQEQRERLRAELTAVLETHRMLLDSHLQAPPVPSSLTNIDFESAEAAAANTPIFPPEPAPFYASDPPDAMMLDDDKDGAEEPEPLDEALTEAFEPGPTEKDE